MNRRRVDPLMLFFLIAAIGFVAVVLWIVVRFSPATPPDPRPPTATVRVVVQPGSTRLPDNPVPNETPNISQNNSTPTPRPTLGPRTPTATTVERILTTPSRAPTETPPATATAVPPETPRPATQRG